MPTAVPTIFQKQRAFFATGATRDAQFRMRQLQRFYDAVRRFEPDITEAVAADFNKPALDTYTTEIGFVLLEIKHAMKHLRSWMRPKRAQGNLLTFGAKGRIYPEPFGVTLVIAPWNYPFMLALSPLIGALAAGNCAVVKPSELTPHTSAVMARLLRETFPEEYVAAVEGGAETSTELLEQPFDYIFFTGSTAVGRIVAEAAAKHLTPVTLELGGKSPCIVHADAKLDLAAKRIAWGKLLNAGQTCVAPDYLFVHRSVKESLLERLKHAIVELYGDVLKDPGRFASIVNDRHFERLTSLLSSGRIVCGGRFDAERRLIEPTLLDEVTWESPVMQEEIFGPILPVLEYDDLDDVIRQINARPKPLALYVFSESAGVQKHIIEQVPYGGGCVNDTILHLSSPALPFGGVGASGTGAYHGKFSFDTFTHYKGVLKQTTAFDLPVRYPTFKNALTWVRRIMK